MFTHGSCAALRTYYVRIHPYSALVSPSRTCQGLYELEHYWFFFLVLFIFLSPPFLPSQLCSLRCLCVGPGFLCGSTHVLCVYTSVLYLGFGYQVPSCFVSGALYLEVSVCLFVLCHRVYYLYQVQYDIFLYIRIIKIAIK